MKRELITTLLFLFPVLPLAACTTPEVKIDSFPQYTKVTAPFTLNEDDGTRIPHGSTIYHWNNGITEVYDPNIQLILVARDSKAADVPHSTPAGSKSEFRPATHQYQVPSGSHITDGRTVENDKITVIYFNDRVILTIVDRDEHYRNP